MTHEDSNYDGGLKHHSFDFAATMLAAAPEENMGLMAQDSSLEKQAKKQLKKIRNRKSGIRNRNSTILPLAFRKPQYTFAVVEPVDARKRKRRKRKRRNRLSRKNYPERLDAGQNICNRFKQIRISGLYRCGSDYLENPMYKTERLDGELD